MGRRLSTSAPPFHDRAHAGDLLARRLSEERLDHLGGDLSDVVVVGLPRGGVAVAAPVAHALAVPLDVVVVRKLGVPWQPEVAAGAVGEGGVRVLNPDVVGLVSTADLEAATRTEQAEVAARVAAWRGRRTGHEVAGRTVVLVDDGIATGATARAAVQVLRALGAARIVLAVPVVARDTAEQLRGLVDDLVALLEPEELWAVGAWYDDFTQVDDTQVRTMLERAHREDRGATTEHTILVDDVPDGPVTLPALVTLPRGAWGLVLFAHGSGSSRLSPRNTAVAEQLHAAGLGTVLLDLLTGPESFDRENVFDVALLGRRLLLATRWTDDLPGAGGLPVGYFGASTGAGAALWAAAEHPDRVHAVVSRGGRPDLAGSRLAEVTVPTLLVVGSLDTQVLALNRAAQRRLRGTSRLDVVPGATHLFEEPGTLHAAADLAVSWFAEHLTR